MSWTKLTGHKCARTIYVPHAVDSFYSLTKAQTACLNLGARCYGVEWNEDGTFNSRNKFYLCANSYFLRQSPESIVYTPDRVPWGQAKSRQCSSTFSQQYPSLIQAQAACLHLGASCHGLSDSSCSGDSFTLCKTSNVAISTTGSCVYTPPKYKWTGLFG